MDDKIFTNIRVVTNPKGEYRITLYENNDYIRYSEKGLENKLNKLSRQILELKKENMEYYQLINCGNCRYHNYDWYSDGDEFEVCDKGHNERLMYHQFCKEWEEL